MGYEVYKALRQHPLILEYCSRTSSRVGLLTNEDLARALDVETIYVGKAVANTAVEDLLQATTTSGARASCLRSCAPPPPLPMTPQSCSSGGVSRVPRTVRFVAGSQRPTSSRLT